MQGGQAPLLEFRRQQWSSPPPPLPPFGCAAVDAGLIQSTARQCWIGTHASMASAQVLELPLPAVSMRRHPWKASSRLAAVAGTHRRRSDWMLPVLRRAGASSCLQFTGLAIGDCKCPGDDFLASLSPRRTRIQPRANGSMTAGQLTAIADHYCSQTCMHLPACTNRLRRCWSPHERVDRVVGQSRTGGTFRGSCRMPSAWWITQLPSLAQKPFHALPHTPIIHQIEISLLLVGGTPLEVQDGAGAGSHWQ